MAWAKHLGGLCAAVVAEKVKVVLVIQGDVVHETSAGIA